MIADLQAEVAAMKSQLAAKESRIAEQDSEIAELKRRLALDSSNSSKPPASDSPFRKPVPRSQRGTSGRVPGGQVGHEGTNLEPVANPDHVIEHRPAACAGCGIALADGDPTVGFSRSQVFDLPDPRLTVTEHRMLKVRCTCGRTTRAADPDGVNAPTQYGPGVHALAVYQLVQQHVPSLRAALGAADLHGAGLSEGFVQAALVRAAARLTPFGEHVVALLQSADVAHFDESGIRAAASLHWVHVACTDRLTWYKAHPKRGKAAMADAGVLPHFTGTLVTDAFSSYLKYGTARALCNAHILRDLDGVHHTDPNGQTWAKAAHDALTAGNNAAHTARQAGRTALAHDEIRALEEQFDHAVRCGRSANPDPPPGQKKIFARQLADRLQRRRGDILRFLHDLNVPFTNNQAEQDIRMAKVQMKVSGGWRTLDGANRWLLVRSYLSTARKHGLNPMTVLRDLFAGEPWLPPLPA
ncbi:MULTISPECIES: IS66 family transposase [unclassified Streptomyces]|uniref:IS66 family transposase n=2 Tax=Streptomyces TaxID=1883 RepID=UPI00226FA545|nr:MULTISPECIES: IS66 family transposase [unclassified Streptomyces]MCY0924177.1 IS66 family transposase [Streptomyces sp. H27-G5]MCY0959925.1 IS66 family transposase [Streptomyces sp. H27-H5]